MTPFAKCCSLVTTFSNFLPTFLLLLILTLQKDVHAISYLRYSEQSCSDLVPRSGDTSSNDLSTSGGQDYSQYYGGGEFPGGSSGSASWDTRSRIRNRYGKRSIGGVGEGYGDEPPYKISVTGRRYRRNADLLVRIEGGEFDGLMIQSRVVAGGEVLRGGVGLIGQFRYLPYLFEYTPCFGLPYASVVDKGRPVKLGNVSFIWTAPDAEAGDIRFIGSVLRGIHYWIIVSNVLSFNPFPISTYACGSSMACFRVCPYGAYPCMAGESLLIFSYSVDLRDKREITFTIGGRLYNNKTYIAVAFGDDLSKLVQADMTVCYLERGRARMEHLLIENLQLPPYQHSEVIELDDYDIDGKMLWCRFRRPINPASIINPRQNLYHFYFWGDIDQYYQRFILPPRNRIFNSAFKRNFSHAFNEIVSGGERISMTGIYYLMMSGFIVILAKT